MPSITDIKNAVTPLARKYGQKKMYLFESYATGTAHEHSDVDLLIEKGMPLSLLKLSGLRQEAMEAVGRDVDIVSLTGISEDFWREIEGTEVLLYEA